MNILTVQPVEGYEYTDLQFSQRYYVTVVRLVPSGLLVGGVVVVETRGVLVKQLPPLILIRLLTKQPIKRSINARNAITAFNQSFKLINQLTCIV